MSVLKRNNVKILGTGDKAMVFSQEYGCDPNASKLRRYYCPMEIGTYLNKNIPSNTLVALEATGHCPNVTIEAIKE